MTREMKKEEELPTTVILSEVYGVEGSLKGEDKKTKEKERPYNK